MLQKAKEHRDFWVKSGNKAILRKILQLTKVIIDSPFEGIGKPEPLKHELTGYWSRRITQEHRFIYTFTDNTLIVVSLKGHYS
ncbi:MAG: Txe/YoeB family addiction module toxin [Candidatus Nephrothrix sp. EaCA]|nr:MAG: Txe/YoeB family addiction module toxin [Candidatus Nephrothrix sp. EaCA]